ncbi:hypothetical protein [Nocardia sp. NPDC052566]|uniref:hypothetical protein n=1 Tax=Nocardia sp. NPDC052566 TaxID=3364330 RepID=UPI0037CAAC39
MVDVEDEDDIRESEQPRPRWASIQRVALLAVFVVAPAAFVIAVVSMLWGVERRRVRTTWWLAWAGVAAAVGLMLAGSSQWWLLLPLQLHGYLARKFLGDRVFQAARGSSVEIANNLLTSDLLHAAVGQLVFGAPVAFLFTAIYVQFRRYERAQLGKLEGAEYSNHRPVGVLDRLRTRRNRTKIRCGAHTTASQTPGDGTVAVGVGTYGAVATLALRSLIVAFLILGVPRSGKTRLANSVASQQVRVLGGGALIIDLKGGDDIPAYWGQVALEENRTFHHFTLNEKSGGRYKRPHPYASPAPAFYDPLTRGNGDSKTNMLLNSVDRDGDAAAYLRTAEDIVMLGFDIADLTGLSAGKGGLETLARMLDLDTLDRQASTLTVDAVLAAHPHMSEADARRRVSDLQQRVQEIVGKSKRNDLLRGAVTDSRTTVSMYANSSALGGRLRPGHGPADTIDLVRAILRNEIVVFSLPTNDYRTLSVLVATMVLLDLQNAASTLRRNIIDVRRLTGDTSLSAGTTPWNPFTVQVEEFSSLKSPAAAAALLGLLNKASDEGLRTIVSSQGVSDLVAIDGTGVWANQALESFGTLASFQLGPADDDAIITAFGGQVDKIKPRVKHTIDTGGRFRLRARARSMNAGVTDTVRETRVPAGVLQALVSDSATDHREFVLITKTPTLSATHTVPEGPNNWYEKLRLVTVKEPPYRHDFFADPHEVEHAQTRREEVITALEHSLRTNPTLAHVLACDTPTDLAAIDSHPTGHDPALSAATDPWATSPPNALPSTARSGAATPSTEDWDTSWDEPGSGDLHKPVDSVVENPTPSIDRSPPMSRDDYIDATEL